jgi:hypothetical protein
MTRVGAVALVIGQKRHPPDRSRRMAPPLTGKSLILHPPIEGEGSMKRTVRCLSPPHSGTEVPGGTPMDLTRWHHCSGEEQHDGVL